MSDLAPRCPRCGNLLVGVTGRDGLLTCTRCRYVRALEGTIGQAIIASEAARDLYGPYATTAPT